MLLGCDLLVSTSEPVLSCLDKQSSQIVVNTNETLPGDFTRDADFRLPVNLLHQRLKSSVAEGQIKLVNATAIATALLGNSIAANLFMLGVAYQRGLIPVNAASIVRAIEINGVEIVFNQQAFQWGRAWVHDASVVENRVSQSLESTVVPELTLEELIEDRARLLIDYQDVAYAERFRKLVGQVRKTDTDKNHTLTRAVARSAYKLMAYKDEYEVARLYTDGRFQEKVRQKFEGDFKLKIHLAPPILSKLNPDSGKLRKRIFGPWVFSVFRRLASMKKLRGTPWDVFGMTAERREERRLVQAYEMLVEELSGQLNSSNYRRAVELAELPEQIRGFGHVKMRAIDVYKTKQSDLLEQFRHPDQQSQVA